MNELEHLFPSKKIGLYGDVNVTVTPIPLSRIGEIISILTPLLDPENKNLEAKQLASIVAKYSLDLLPLCVDIPVDKIPLAVLPDIIDALLDFNFPLETLKKWVALGTRIKTLREALVGGSAKASVKR